MKYICILTLWMSIAACSRQPGQTTPVTSRTVSASPSAAPLSAEPVTGEPQPDCAPAIIPVGTRLRVRMGQTLDTRRTRPGQRFVAYLAEPLMAGNRIVIPKGTTFTGHVVEAKSSGRLKGRAVLGVTLDSFSLSGATYPIATAADLRASRSHKKRNLEIIGGGSGAGAATGAVAGGGVGALIGAGAGAAAGTTGAIITGKKNVTIPAETSLSFTLHREIALGS